MTSIITYLHAVMREVEPTPDEWMTAIQFLTATGQISDDVRQELILLSDTLGVSMLVDAIWLACPSAGRQHRRKLLRAQGRHPWRLAHFHFIVSAPVYKSLTTRSTSCQSRSLLDQRV